MSGVFKAAADALDVAAGALHDAADALREVEPDDDRYRARARERQRRYRASRNSDATPLRDSDAADAQNSSSPRGPLRVTPPKGGDDVTTGGPSASRNSDATRNASRDVTGRDAHPSSWHVDPPTDEEREAGQARIRALREQLKSTKGKR